MIKKFVYITVIFVISIVLYGFLSNNNYDANTNNITARYLTNKQSTEPKKLFLKTWRIIKNKYYDSNLNGQDWNKWNKRYIDQIKNEDDAYVAINTMLASLDDPYSRFMNKEEYSEQNTNIDAQIVGIGVNIMSIDGKIVIVSVVENTPAHKAGLKAGDIILKTDNIETSGKSVNDAAMLIRGEINTIVSLEILRKKQKFIKNIKREEIKIKNIKSEIIEKNIGYIQIVSFISSDIPKEFIEAIQNTQDCEGLIIDLRGNTGGLLPNAIIIANMFLQEGNIVSIVNREKQKSDIDAQTKPYTINKPLVLLIDEATASASEILSGALKDNKKAILVGKKTFGKGMIQKIFPLPNGTGMNLTIAKYLTPNGNDINKTGIKPDYEINFTETDFYKNKDPQLDKAKMLIKDLIKSQNQLANVN